MPQPCQAWLKAVEARSAPPDVACVPGSRHARPYILATTRFAELRFTDHRFNPRQPDEAKVKELLASIRRLSLLNPLIAAHVPAGPESAEAVVLIDGRHRYEALGQLAAEDPEWKEHGRVDVKVYYGLAPSELRLLATYLNRHRRALKKGEYYRSVARIYEDRAAELRKTTRRHPTEVEVVGSLHGRELANRDFDATVGRLVALAAFEPNGGDSWHPLVSNSQNGVLGPETGLTGFAPITAGNLAEFTASLCLTRPYSDDGATRRQELANLVEVGRIFRRHFLRPVADREKANATTIACKFWVLSAFGRILERSSLFSDRPAGTSPLGWTPLDAKRFDRIVAAYAEIMEDQATVVNRYRDTDRDEFLDRAWSYQTQRNQVAARLLRQLQAKVPKQVATFR